MGFRSYIRQFLVAILMFFRPSGPCCLSVAEAPFLSLEIPIRELSFEQKEYQEQEQQQQQQEEKVAKIILFYGFQKLHAGVFGCNFDAFPSFTAMVFSHPGAVF